MKRGSIGVLLLSACLLVGAWLTSAPPATSQDVSFVRVTNFPPVQEINGKVEIDAPIRLAKLVAVREITLPPVRSDQTTRWVDGGIVETSGFPNVVLSLNGEIKGELLKPAAVVAVLVPTEKSVVDAFDQEGVVQFGLDVSANGQIGSKPYFASNQPRYTVGFDAYRVYFYNETDKTVTANLFAYLTN